MSTRDILLENLVFTGLRRNYPEIFYYKTRTGRETDFIVPLRSGPILVQVCETLADPQIKKREMASLGEAMKELGVTTGRIVTRNEEECLEGIQVIPAWKFLLELPQI